MSLWWGLAALVVLIILVRRWWTRRQAMIAEIDYFVTALLPVIESEPGKLGHLVVSFREPSMSMEYNTEDGITILAGVGRARSYVEVGACSVDPNESWDFDATA